MKASSRRLPHLHFKLKVLVLPLPAEEVTRDADPDALLEGGARPQGTRDQALERKTRGERVGGGWRGTGRQPDEKGSKKEEKKGFQHLFSFIVSNIKPKIDTNKNKQPKQ